MGIFMKLNKEKLLNILSNIEYVGLIKQRKWNTIIDGKTCGFWNNLICSEIFNSQYIKGKGIDINEFNNFCGSNYSKKDTNKIFFMINKKSRCILENELIEFLEIVDDNDYKNIIKCLEDDLLPVIEPELDIKNLDKEIIKKGINKEPNTDIKKLEIIKEEITKEEI